MAYEHIVNDIHRLNRPFPFRISYDRLRAYVSANPWLAQEGNKSVLREATDIAETRMYESLKVAGLGVAGAVLSGVSCVVLSDLNTTEMIKGIAIGVFATSASLAALYFYRSLAYMGTRDDIEDRMPSMVYDLAHNLREKGD